MKKIVSVLSALLCVFGLSVMSFAASGTVFSPSDYNDVSDHGSYYSLDTVIPASTFNDEQMAFWNEFTSVLTSGSGGIALISRGCPSSVRVDSFKFILVTGNYKFGDSSTGAGYVCIKPSSSGVYFRCLEVKSVGGSITVSAPFKSIAVEISNFGTSGYCLFNGYSRLSNVSSETHYVDFKGKPLQINDDLGGEDPDTPSSSSEPDTPSSGGWQPPVVSDPEIPAGDEYVFYDTAVLKQFLNYVRDAMGKAINVGWLIFGFILMWLLIKKVIKAFSSR